MYLNKKQSIHIFYLKTDTETPKNKAILDLKNKMKMQIYLEFFNKKFSLWAKTWPFHTNTE